ncbi:MAG: CHAT domain-containing protein [Spirochaetia bacterium]|jgi:CHAT domain-containing protein
MKKILCALVLVLTSLPPSLFAETAYDLASQAWEKAEAGDFKAAFALYERAVAIDPKREATYLDYGWHLFMSGDPKKAVEKTLAGYALAKTDWQFPARLAMYSFASGDSKSGEKWHAAMALLDPPVYEVIKQLRQEMEPESKLFASPSLCTAAAASARAAMLPRHPDFDALAQLFDIGWEGINVADTAWKDGKYDAAFTGYSAIIELWQPFGDTEILANLYFFAGACLNLENKHAEGLKSITQGLTVMERLKLSGGESEAMGHFHAGQCCFWLGRFDEAVTHLKEAAALYEMLGEHDSMAYAYDYASIAAIDAGDLRQAAAFALYTLKRIDSSDMPLETAAANVDLAEFYVLAGQIDKANACLKTAEKLYKDEKDPGGSARAAVGRAMAAAMGGDRLKGAAMAAAAAPILAKNGLDIPAVRTYLVAFFFSIGSMDMHSLIRNFNKLAPEDKAAQIEALKQARGYAEAGLEIINRHGGGSQAGLFLMGMALSWQAENRYDTALPLWKKAVAFYENRPERRTEYLGTLEGLGACQEGLEDWKAAADSYRALVALYADAPADAARQQLSLGRMLEEEGEFADAEKELSGALTALDNSKDAAPAAEAEYEIAKTDTALLRTADAESRFSSCLKRYHAAGDPAGEGTARQFFADALMDWGRFQDALEQLKAAETLYEVSDQRYALLQSSLGSVYAHIGDAEHALEAANRAVELCTRYGHTNLMGTALLGQGKQYQDMGWHDRAIESYQKALALAEQDKDSRAETILYNNLSQAYRSVGKYDDAARCLQLYMESAKNANDKKLIADTLNSAAATIFSMAEVQNTVLKVVDMVVNLYDQALVSARDQGDTLLTADIQHNKAYANMVAGRYDQAIAGFGESVAAFDAIRSNLKGEARRSFLSKAIFSYHYLVMTLIMAGQYRPALESLEAATGLYFSESLGDTSAPLKSDALTTAVKSLPADTAVLILVPVQGRNEATVMMGIVATGTTVRGAMLDLNTFVEQFQDLNPQQVDRAITSTRGLTIVRKEIAQSAKTTARTRDYVDFEDIVTVYRSLLSNPQSDLSELQKMSQKLYAFLLAPWDKELAGVKNLVIIPNGVLAFLPFETLRGPDGRYLVERCDVRYVQSLRVLEYLRSRTHPANRKPMLALGGADYAFKGPDVDRAASDDQILAVSSLARRLMEAGKDLRETYAALGIRAWPPLPGTMAEVKNLAATYKNAEIVTGKAVNERYIDSRSDSGELRAYKVIHIAGHGVVVPEAPELSALVLSQAPGDGSSMDGYLTVSEVARLHLSADFVNLSACETGLGRVYQGEGVAGLAQSFLIAGADAVSVSLWQVADKSTADFMTGFYSLVNAKGMSYSAAMMEMKRTFIKKPEYRHPFYWAPFVYYGR